jgi:hypothetical protein
VLIKMSGTDGALLSNRIDGAISRQRFSVH